MSTGINIENQTISQETLVELRMTIREVLAASCGDAVKQSALALLAGALNTSPITVSNCAITLPLEERNLDGAPLGCAQGYPGKQTKKSRAR